MLVPFIQMNGGRVAWNVGKRATLGRKQASTVFRRYQKKDCVQAPFRWLADQRKTNIIGAVLECFHYLHALLVWSSAEIPSVLVTSDFSFAATPEKALCFYILKQEWWKLDVFISQAKLMFGGRCVLSVGQECFAVHNAHHPTLAETKAQAIAFPFLSLAVISALAGFYRKMLMISAIY